MGITAFIDVAIGLLVVYLAASLMVTVFNEWLSQVREWRRQVLAKSLDQLFNGGQFALATERLPGLALLDGLLKTQDARADPALLARGIAAALGNGIHAGKVSLEAVRNGVRELPDSRAKQALSALAATCADDLEQFVRETATWIDHALTDLGQSYRNRMQLVSFLFGLTIAVGFNIDTLHLVDRLYADKAMRDQLVATAEGLTGAAKPEQLQGCAAEWLKSPAAMSSACAPVGRLLTAVATGPADARTALPIGWGEGRRQSPAGTSMVRDALLSLLGWMLTAVAVSFGAPFWFDLLGKLLNLRRGFAAKPASETAP